MQAFLHRQRAGEKAEEVDVVPPVHGAHPVFGSQQALDFRCRLVGLVFALAKLQGDVATILKMPDVQKRFTELGAEPGNISGAAFGRFLADETAKWTKIIQSSGATIN